MPRTADAAGRYQGGHATLPRIRDCGVHEDMGEVATERCVTSARGRRREEATNRTRPIRMADGAVEGSTVYEAERKSP
jgi:hypothetical protein